MRYGFGVDIHGSYIKFGFFSEQGELLEKWDIPGQKDSNLIIPAVAEEVEWYLTQHGIFEDDIIGIGVAIPGPVSNSGVVNKCVNFSWGIFNIDRALSGLTGLRVKSSNSANLAALGECWKGSGSRNMVLMSMNTGLGGGIVCNGAVVNGAAGGAGEIGHIIVNRNETEPCTCGRYGCAEQYVSPKGVARVARRMLSNTRTPSVLRSRRFFEYQDVLRGAAGGDKVCRDVMSQVYDYAGQVLAAVCCVTNPDTVVLGGEFSKIGQSAAEGIARAFRKYVFHANEGVKFQFAALGEDKTIYGAFRLACETFASED